MARNINSSPRLGKALMSKEIIHFNCQSGAAEKFSAGVFGENTNEGVKHGVKSVADRHGSLDSKDFSA